MYLTELNLASFYGWVYFVLFFVLCFLVGFSYETKKGKRKNILNHYFLPTTFTLKPTVNHSSQKKCIYSYARKEYQEI